MVVSTAGTGDRAVEGAAAVADGPPGAVAPPVGFARRRPDPRWVDAGPFRAHLRHLMSVGRLDVPEMAVVLGLSTPAVRHLLEGRAGRVPRRISPETARRLLVVSADDVQGLRWCLAPTTTARTSLDRLRTSGWTTAEVASAVGFGLDELASVEQRTHCNRLLAVRLVGLARRLPSTVDDEDLLDAASAA